MKKTKKQSQTITIQCPEPMRITTRKLHYQLFELLRSGKRGCFVVTHLGVPRMVSFLVEPEVGYLLLGKGSKLEVTMD